tara:strand:+ start:464 stop:1132 length:669 start_codon:yes stop_codon:yes gene_type:complete
MKISFKFYFLLFIFFILTTYNTKEKDKRLSIFFPIKKILIENTVGTDLIKIKSDLSFLRNKSLFFLNTEKILANINEYDFISTIQLKKKYPSTLRITIIEKIPIAVQIIDKKKFYITKDNEKISFIDLKKYENLPLIFGKYKNFYIFYKDLEKSNFNLNEIKAFYYFDIGRWDIVLRDEKIIKLPEKNYQDILLKINSILGNNNFFKYKVFDFRIKDQLILK